MLGQAPGSRPYMIVHPKGFMCNQNGRLFRVRSTVGKVAGKSGPFTVVDYRACLHHRISLRGHPVIADALSTAPEWEALLDVPGILHFCKTALCSPTAR